MLGMEEYLDGLVKDCSNSSANAPELLQSCTKPSRYWTFEVNGDGRWWVVYNEWYWRKNKYWTHDVGEYILSPWCECRWRRTDNESMIWMLLVGDRQRVHYMNSAGEGRNTGSVMWMVLVEELILGLWSEWCRWVNIYWAHDVNGSCEQIDTGANFVNGSVGWIDTALMSPCHKWWLQRNKY